MNDDNTRLQDEETIQNATAAPADTPADAYNPDEFLPDGWTEGDDFLTEEPGDSETDTETPADGSDAAEPGTDTPEGADASEAPETPSEKPGRKITLRIDHQDKEVDVDSLTDEQIKEALEKSAALDRIREKENRQRYRDAYAEQRQQGMSDALARIAAREAAGADYPLTDDAPEAAPGDAAGPTASPAPRDFAADLKALRAAYPDVTEMPEDVVAAYMQGKPLLDAYRSHRGKAEADELSRLRKENEQLRAAEDARRRAPVRGVSGGSAGKQTRDPFEEGFDSDW